MNTGAPWPSLDEANARVLGIQTKLHRWAGDNDDRRFDDLFNLVCDPAFLLIAWNRVRNNRGARTAGVDGETARYIEARRGVEVFLDDLRADLKARTFQPQPVREVMIPKPGTRKRRRLGIPTVRDRVVQAALKLVLEPIFEAGFQPCSYGFRLRRRTQDAIAEIHYLGSRSYEWVLEVDIEACFDRIEHSALMDRVRRRIGDKAVLALVKAFLKAGILIELGRQEDSVTGTPQGGILSPLLANIALSVLDDHFIETWQTVMSTSMRRTTRRRKGLGTWRLVRYADDFVVMVAGTRDNAEALRDEVASVLAPMGLRLSEDKTRVVHLDEGFDFLGFRIRRRRKRGTNQHHVYTYPSKKALAAVKAKVRRLTHRTSPIPPRALLLRVNAVLRGWANYFKHGVSKRTFSYLDSYAWRRVTRWLRRRHKSLSWKALRRRFMRDWDIVIDGVTLVRPSTITVSRYRYRGTRIATPWTAATSSTAS
ncbi:MAG: group II intron reverse transcriptase/maturase [Actinobacteria bacterium]|nr:group II intron reverse transcriptase/maturase [Actinomycetota bacterium]